MNYLYIILLVYSEMSSCFCNKKTYSQLEKSFEIKLIGKISICLLLIGNCVNGSIKST